MVYLVKRSRSNLRIFNTNEHHTTSQYQNIKTRLIQVEPTYPIQYKDLIGWIFSSM